MRVCECAGGDGVVLECWWDVGLEIMAECEVHGE